MTNSRNREFIFETNFKRIRPFTMLMAAQVRCIYGRFLETLDIPGDVIEFGCNRGGLSFFLALLIKQLGLKKKVYMLDSFEGLPEINKGVDGPFVRGTMKASRDRVESMAKELDIADTIEIVPGWFDQSVRSLPSDVRFSFAHIDADIYSSTSIALDFVRPLLNKGAALFLDDFLFHGATGVSKAVEEVLGKRVHLYLGPKTQAYCFPHGDLRKTTRKPQWRKFGKFRVDVSDLLTDKKYLQHLKGEQRHYEKMLKSILLYQKHLVRSTSSRSDETYAITPNIGTIMTDPL